MPNIPTENPEGGDEVKCPCKEHLGQVLLDSVYDMGIEYLIECMVGGNHFTRRINEARKITDIQAGEWEEVVENDQTIKKRRLEYNVGLNGTLGAKSCKTIENTKMLVREIGRIAVLESETVSTGVPYSDSFLVRTRLCIVRSGASSVRLVAHVAIVFITKPMAFIKKVIEKSCMGTISGYFTQLDQFLKEEAVSKKNEELNAAQSLDTKSSPVTKRPRRLKPSAEKRIEDVEKPRSDSSDSSPSSSSLKQPDDDDDSSEEDQGLRLRKPAKYAKDDSVRLSRSTTTASSQRDSNGSFQQSIRLNGDLLDRRRQQKEIRLIVKPDESSPNQMLFIGFEMNSSMFLNFFFIIMVVLVVFNLVLYLKLREIENLAQFIKRNKFPNTLPSSNV